MIGASDPSEMPTRLHNEGDRAKASTNSATTTGDMPAARNAVSRSGPVRI